MDNKTDKFPAVAVEFVPTTPATASCHAAVVEFATLLLVIPGLVVVVVADIGVEPFTVVATAETGPWRDVEGTWEVADVVAFPLPGTVDVESWEDPALEDACVEVLAVDTWPTPCAVDTRPTPCAVDARPTPCAVEWVVLEVETYP